MMNRRPSTALWIVLLALLPALVAVDAQAQQRESERRPADEPIKVFAYRFEHQSALDALTVIEPLLSQRGTIELKKADNTLVIRDVLQVMRRVVPRLRDFDHPVREISLEILLVRAQRASYSPTIVHDDLPAELAAKLRKVMPYFTSHELIADSDLRSKEGEEVTYEIGGGYRVSYRTGTMMHGQTVKLYDLTVSRAGSGGDGHMMRTQVPLNLGKPFALALAKSEESRNALMIVMTPTLVSPAEEVR